MMVTVSLSSISSMVFAQPAQPSQGDVPRGYFLSHSSAQNASVAPTASRKSTISPIRQDLLVSPVEPFNPTFWVGSLLAAWEPPYCPLTHQVLLSSLISVSAATFPSISLPPSPHLHLLSFSSSPCLEHASPLLRSLL